MIPYSLVTFETAQGPRAGIVVDGQVHDAATLCDRQDYASMDGILRDWSSADARFQSLAPKLRENLGIPLADISLLAPLPAPGAVLCTGSNYKCHSDAMEKAAGLPPSPNPKELGLKPYCFLKVSRCVVGPGAGVELTGPRLDWEGELAVVIGRTAKNVPVERALDYVAAYTVANDLSARDRFFRPQEEEDTPFRFSWFNHKCFDGSCPTGPALVPARFIRDPHDLAIRLWVNDELKQDSTTANMIFDIAEQIAEYSSRITLQPGDMILTGTPAGTGAESKTFLSHGDRIRVEVEQIGALEHTIV